MNIKQILATTCIMVLAVAHAYATDRTAPQWWTDRGVILTGETIQRDDYVAINQGQLKHVVHQAFLEMDERYFPGGVGPEIRTLVQGWLTAKPGRDDYQAVTLGQLKYVASLFYNRLIALGHETAYPWAESEANPDDFALANIGQVKYLFAFHLDMYQKRNPNDWDGNGIPDEVDRRAFGVEPRDPAVYESISVVGNGEEIDPRRFFHLIYSRNVTIGEEINIGIETCSECASYYTESASISDIITWRLYLDGKEWHAHTMDGGYDESLLYTFCAGKAGPLELKLRVSFKLNGVTISREATDIINVYSGDAPIDGEIENHNSETGVITGWAASTDENKTVSRVALYFWPLSGSLYDEPGLGLYTPIETNYGLVRPDILDKTGSLSSGWKSMLSSLVIEDSSWDMYSGGRYLFSAVAFDNAGGRKLIGSMEIDIEDIEPVDPDIDSNNNGIPDDWEYRWFDGLINASDIAFPKDQGGDGLTHKMKYLLGFDPRQVAQNVGSGEEETTRLFIHTPSNSNP